VKVGERKMKEKAYIGIVFATLLIASTFAVLTTKAAYKGTITIGIIGPYGLPHWEPAGMKPAAEMAADEINAAGGIALADGNYEVVLKFGNEYAYPSPDPAAAASEVERLITVEGCEYIIGGFRTECTTTMVEKAMDYGIPFFINGAATNELMSLTVNKTDPTLYARYKYLFRGNPTNGTILLRTVAATTQYLVATKLRPLFAHQMTSPMTYPTNPALGLGFNSSGVQVKVAILMEDLAWTQTMYYYFTTKQIYPYLLGPYVNVTYAGRIPDGTADCTPWLQSVKDSGARLLIHVFSGVTGDPLLTQWHAMNVSALPLGINVMGQLQTHWSVTAGGCEYESFTNYLGTRTDVVPGVTTVFWDKFVSKTGVWPIYTASGAYNLMYTLADGLKGVGTKDKDALVAYYENPAYEVATAAGVGKSKFDSTHDLFSSEYSYTWTQGYVRSLVVQWQNGRMEVVSPADKIYSKKFAIPPWMYPLKTDINYDGKINIMDISAAAKAFGTKPGDARWDKESDVNLDGQINIMDITKIAVDWNKSVTLPLD
jgi:ABC-type branched-subunit amino acid transport system substrate-binding protein